MKNKIKILIGISLLFIFQAQALIDTKNASYTKTFTDIVMLEGGLPIQVVRTYNSRSLYKGIFGYGWCSNLETRLEVMPDNTLMVVECGGGAEVSYISKEAQIDNDYKIKVIMKKVKNTKGISHKYIKKVESDLKNSPLLQSELIRAYQLSGKVKKGKTYTAVGRQNNYIQFIGTKYKRFLSNGKIQFFNKEGLLIKTMDKSGNWIKIHRRNNIIVKIINNIGQSLYFKTKQNVLTVKGSNNFKAIYNFKQDNLVKVINSKRDSYEYFYDSFHNLTQTCYSDKTCESLVYNTGKDWVISFQDRKSCIERYNYKTNKRNADHYWTKVVKTCGSRVTNNSLYEFWNKKNNKGGKYLYRAKQEVNKNIIDVIFDMETGLPLRVTQNKNSTFYSYYKKESVKGFLKSKFDSRKKLFFTKYDKKCKKPTKLTVQYMRGKKVAKKVHTYITYDSRKCHLVKAHNNMGRGVMVKRDYQGRISEMWDQSNKRILVQYNEKYSKPKKITRPGVGSILVFYNKDGSINVNKVKSDPAVAVQITNVFNNFIEIISPVVSNVSI